MIDRLDKIIYEQKKWRNLLRQPEPKKTNIFDPNAIFFFSAETPYYEFTNFYEGAPITIDGIEFKTGEHYYQWQKFADHITKQRILDAKTARLATNVANSNRNLIVKNFDRNAAMLNVFRVKFTQYKELADALISTATRPLIEHNMHDDYWADGGDGTGRNYFGILLMQVRSELVDGKLKY